MKKTLYITGLLFISLYSSAQSLSREQLRTHYIQALHNRSALDSFIFILQKNDKHSPVEESYYGICQGMKAQYADGMFTKLRLVQKSKSLMNEAIVRDTKDPELRFMRFTLEHYIPSYLGMSADLNADLSAIFADADFLKDNTDLKKLALNFILDTKRCNPDQKRQIEISLSELNNGSIAQK